MSTANHSPRPGPEPAGRRGRGSPVVGVVALAAAAAAALSPASPTGTRSADAVWCALLAGVVALAGSRARPSALLWLTALAALLAVRGDVGPAVVAVAALLGALALVLLDGRRPSPPAAGAAVAGAATAALLWAPGLWFTGFPTLIGLVAIAPVLAAGWRSLGRPGRRRAVAGGAALAAVLLVAVAVSVVVALSLRGSVTDAAHQARAGLSLVRDGDVEQAVPGLDAASGEFADAADRLDGPLGLPGRLVPVVGQQLEALRRVSAAGAELTDAAARAADEADYQQLRSDSGQVDVGRVVAMQGPVDRSLAAANRAQAVVAQVRSPWLLAPLADQLDDLSAELDDTVPSVELASRALAVAPALLGGDGDQRYLLQFATPAESRAAGGYVGTYGLLVARGGRLDLQLTGSTEDLNQPALADQPRTFAPPPGWEERYASFRVDRFPGNLTADPDWPTDAGVARQLYAQVDGVGPVDGALYADPTALAALLQLTGPVYVPSLDRQLSADDVEQFLLVDQYVVYDSDDDTANRARREVLGDVAEAVFDAISSRQLPSLRAVVDVLGPTVAGGHLKLSVFDETAEALFEEIGLNGAWDPTPGADYVSLRTTDLFSNKIDSFVERSVAVDVDHDPGTGSVRSTVTVTLRNDAPSSGLPWYVIGNYSDLPGGTARDGVSVYTPLALERATLDGEAVDLQHQAYGTGNVYQLPVTLASGQARELTLVLAGTVPRGLPYRLDLLPQPRADADRYVVTTGGPGGAPVFDGPVPSPTLVGEAALR